MRLNQSTLCTLTLFIFAAYPILATAQSSQAQATSSASAPNSSQQKSTEAAINSVASGTPGSLSGPRPAPMRAGRDAYIELQKREFDSLDAKHDGHLTADEFMVQKRALWSKYASPNGMTIEACAQASLDASLERLKSQPQKTGIPDGAKPVDAAKASSDFGPMFTAACKRMDHKNKGVLSWEDYGSSTWNKFKELDRNHDGVVDFEEYSKELAMRSAQRQPKKPSAELQAKIDQDLLHARSSVQQKVGAGAGQPAYVRPQSPRNAASTAQAAGQTQSAPTQPTAQETLTEKISNWFR